MSSGLGVPVAASMSMGIAFVIIFSMLLPPAASSLHFSPGSMDKLNSKVIANANKLKEAHLFFSEYPEAQVKVDRTKSEVERSAVRYNFQKMYEDGRTDDIRMYVMFDDRTTMPTGQILLQCVEWHVYGSGGITFSNLGDDIAKELQSAECAR